MSKERECARALRGIVGKSPFNTYLATVKEVSENEAVCTVKRVLDDMEIKDVKLNATITNNEGMVIRPKKDSAVLITSIDGANWFVSQYSDIEKITIDANDKIIFNGGHNDGLIQIGKLTQKLNELVNTFNSHTHPVPNGTSSAPGMSAASFNKNDYEDTNITH